MSALCSCAESKAIPRPQLDFALPEDNPHYNIHTSTALFILYKIKNLGSTVRGSLQSRMRQLVREVYCSTRIPFQSGGTQTIKKVKTNPSTHTWVYRNPHAILNLATVLGER